MLLTATRTRVVLTIISLSLTLQLDSQAYFDYNEEIKRAYNYVLQLKTDSASIILNELKVEEPLNLASLHIENYIDFFTVFLGEEKADLERFKDRKDIRLERIKEGSVNSPLSKFAQAEIILQYALARSKFGEYIRAGWDISRANKLLSKNQKQYPQFLLNNKSLSIIHALMGSLKGIQKSLIKIFTSLDGNYAQGIKEIDELFYSTSEDKGVFSIEIRAIRALISLHVEKEPTEALRIIDIEEVAQQKSPLLDFVRYTVAKQNKESQKELIQYLESALSHQVNIPFEYLNLLMGIELLQKGDFRAKQYLLNFKDRFDGRHYIKEAYQKLAWYELILNNSAEGYTDWMQKLRRSGYTTIGEDQLAQKEALAAEVPNRSILSARILYDGRNYNEALDKLSTVELQSLNNKELLEFYYRKARCLQGLNYNQEAIRIYKQVISLDSDDKEYYACSSALQSGIIHVRMYQLDQAQQMLKLCLKLKPNEHRESLHQKAQSWLQKIKGH